MHERLRQLEQMRGDVMHTRFPRQLIVIYVLLGLVLASVPVTAQEPPQVLLNGSPLPLPADQQPLGRVCLV